MARNPFCQGFPQGGGVAEVCPGEGWLSSVGEPCGKCPVFRRPQILVDGPLQFRLLRTLCPQAGQMNSTEYSSSLKTSYLCSHCL